MGLEWCDGGGGGWYTASWVRRRGECGREVNVCREGHLIENPSFHPSAEAMRKARALLAEPAVGVRRPVVMLSGYHSPEFPVAMMHRRLLKYGAVTGDQSVVVTYRSAGMMEEAALKAKAEIAAKGWEGREVDIVAHSMGGLIARMLIADHGLAVRRLYTLSTPHRGALMAERTAPDEAGRDLIAGSARILGLDAALPKYLAGGGELVCYVTLRDWMVGARRCAPPGMTPIWLDMQRWYLRWLSHFNVVRDDRIMVDLALRLRGEVPLSRVGEPPPRD